MCVVTNSLGVCSAGTSEQGTMELGEIIHGQPSERTGTLLCVPSHSTGSSPPSRKTRAAAQDGNSRAAVGKGKYRISLLQPTPPPAPPGNQGRNGPLGCPAASGVRYPPLRFYRSLPPTYLEIYVLEIASRLRKLLQKCEAGLSRPAGTTHEKFRPTVQSRPTDMRAD